ncbi:MAG: hypothetical protein ACYCVN_15015 [Acidimicrobiales bacterium]
MAWIVGELVARQPAAPLSGRPAKPDFGGEPAVEGIEDLVLAQSDNRRTGEPSKRRM